MRFLFLVLISCGILSCSVQKRKYRSGFYVAGHGKSLSPAKKPVVRIATSETLPQPDLFAGADQKIVLTENSSRITFSTPPDSCDVITMKNGTEIRAKVIEIGVREIVYKRCNHPDGPVYRHLKKDVFLIKFKNGTRELVKEEEEPLINTPSQTQPQVHQYNKLPAGPDERIIHPLASGALVSAISAVILPYISLVLVTTGIWFAIPTYFLVVMALCALAAVVMGIIAKNDIKNYPEKFKGKGLAIPGYIVGVIASAIWALVGLIILTSRI